MRHPDEGTIQGWIEGQLPAGDAGAVEAHVQGCAECQALAAEIRGLMARSSGIVGALDDGEGRVRPVASAVSSAAGSAAGSAASPASAQGWAEPARVRRAPAALRRWVPALAAAAVVLAVMRQASSDDTGRERVREALRGDAVASAPAAAPVPPLPGAAVGEAAGAPAAVPADVPAPRPAPAPAPRPDSRPPSAVQRGDVRAADAAMRAQVAVGAEPPADAPAPAPAPGVIGAVARDESRRALAAGAAQAAPTAAAAPPPLPADVRTARRSAAKILFQEATNTTFAGCYRVISQYFSQVILANGGIATVVGGDSTAGRWATLGDSIEVRWGDSLAVFPAGRDRSMGRVEAGGESRPLTVWRGCPAR